MNNSHNMDAAKKISAWIKDYAESAGMQSLVVGISGGIDSSVVSTLCAMTGMKTIVLTMPIRQKPDQHDLSLAHAEWLCKHYPDTVEHRVVDLTETFEMFESLFEEDNKLAFANSRSRLRMVTLYQVAQTNRGLVVGTGNKVEDFGIGFYTKYGDGGVDILPIADLMKTEVWAVGKSMGIDSRIINAAPTDGLWDDGRTDEDQLEGLDYADLEEAMRLVQATIAGAPLEAHEQRLVDTYNRLRGPNLHKMEPIPVCPKPGFIAK